MPRPNLSETTTNRDSWNNSVGWNNPVGDWWDRAARPQGSTPWASAVVKDTDTPRFVTFDVTDWAQAVFDNPDHACAVLVRGAGGTDTKIATRAATNAAERPKISYDGGADQTCTDSVQLALGSFGGMTASPASVSMAVPGAPTHLLIEFPAPTVRPTSAVISLYTPEQYADQTVSIFWLRFPPEGAPALPLRKFGTFLSQRWKRQPQGPVEIDWAHPMSRGLRGCFLGSSPINLVNRGFVTAGGSANITRFMRVGAAGRAFETQQYDGPLLQLARRSPAGTQQLEFAGHVEFLSGLPSYLPNTGTNYKSIIAYNSTSQNGLGVYLSGGELYPSVRLFEIDDVTTGGFDGLTVRLDAASPVPQNKPFSMFAMVTWSANGAPTNNEELQFGVGGRVETTQRYTAFGNSANDLNLCPLAYADQYSSPLYRTYTAAFWDRRRSDAERLEYDQAPYQFLKPVRPRAYSLPSQQPASRFGTFQPRRWRTQPQGPSEIDWGHPLAKGLVCAVSDSYEAVTRRRLAFDARISRSPSPEGIGWYRETELASGPNLSTSTGTKVPSGSQFTIAAVVRADQSANGGSQAVAYWGNDPRFWWSQPSEQFVFAPRDSAGTLTYAVDYGATSAIMRAGTTVAGVWDGGHIRLYRGGAQQASTALTSISTAANEDVLVGVNNAFYTFHWRGWIPGLNAWARPLSAGELREWHDNPWQFYRSRRPIIYSLPLAGILLSNTTVIDIGATSARVRTTITYPA